MHCFLMQSWIAIRGQSTITTITESADCWLDLSPFQDIVAWLECKQFSAGTGGTNVQMAYQSAPTKDDSLFVPVVAAFNVATGVTTTVMLKDVVTNPLCRWLRWQLTVTGSPSTAWDATFRVFIAANVVGRGGTAKAPAAVMTAAAAARSSGPVRVAIAAPSTPLHLQAQPFSPTYGSAYPVGQYNQAVPLQFQGTAVQQTSSTPFNAPSSGGNKNIAFRRS